MRPNFLVMTVKRIEGFLLADYFNEDGSGFETFICTTVNWAGEW